MATKTLLKSGNFRIQIREKGLKLISRTFDTEQQADSYAMRLSSELKSLAEADKAKLPVDKVVLFRSLHPDLQKVAQLLPMFSSVLGEIMGNDLTLARLIDEFINQYEKKDQSLYLRLKWWTEHYGTLQVSEITESHVRHGINTLLTVGSTGNRGISPQTTNRFKANLSSVFEFGKNKYHLKLNPCQGIKGRPEGKGRTRYLSAEEQKRFILAAKQSSWNKFYLLILMAITTGARRGELMKLRWSDINWETQQAHCSDTKNGSDKVLPLTDAVVLELKRHREIGNGLLFGSPQKPSVPYDCRFHWDTALAQAEIAVIDSKGEKIVFHSLRHTFCSTLANTGAELHEIATLAGHKNLQTTMRYTHTNAKKLASVVNTTFCGLA